jgi:hypothetical protein
MTDSGTLASLRSRIGDPVNRRFPRLSWNLWSARRDLEQLQAGNLVPAVRNQWHQRVSRPRVGEVDDVQLLIIIASVDHVEIPYLPASGNYSYELVETAREMLGEDHVQTLRIAAGTPAAAWHDQVLGHLKANHVTHVLARTDIEPNGTKVWTWDTMLKGLRASWPGVFLPLSYDSAYPIVAMHVDRLTRLHERVMPVVLDRPISPVLRPFRPSAGPLFLPLSTKTTHLIDDALAGTEPDLDLTFIGNVNGYPYRAGVLEGLAQAGLNVVVNPHIDDTGAIPDFTAFARALRRSRVTLNFSRCNGEPVTQLKTRMLEGSLFGSVVASDSTLYAGDYFDEGEEFIGYSSPDDLRRRLEQMLSEPGRLDSMRSKARAKADQLRVANFWTVVDQALTARALPSLQVAAKQASRLSAAQ